MGYRNLIREKIDLIKSLFLFQGRIKRSTYWLAVAPFFMLSIIILIASLLRETYPEDINKILLLAFIFYVPATWILISSYIKRWHDLGKSGWMVLIQFIPVINVLIFIYLGAAAGNTYSNKYGEPPKSYAAVAIKSCIIIFVLLIFLIVTFCGREWEKENSYDFIFNELECGMNKEFVSNLAKNNNLKLKTYNQVNNINYAEISKGKDYIIAFYDEDGNLSEVAMPKWPISFFGIIAGSSTRASTIITCQSALWHNNSSH